MWRFKPRSGPVQCLAFIEFLIDALLCLDLIGAPLPTSGTISCIDEAPTRSRSYLPGTSSSY